MIGGLIDIKRPGCYHWLNQMNNKANVFIKITWIAGLIWIIISTIISLGSFFFFAFFHIFSVFFYPFILGAVINFLIVSGLVIGIYKKSRVCSILLFVHAVLHLIPSVVILIWKIIDGWHHFWVSQIYGNIISLIIFLVFSVIFFLGIRGTFSHHKVLKAAAIP